MEISGKYYNIDNCITLIQFTLIDLLDASLIYCRYSCSWPGKWENKWIEII